MSWRESIQTASFRGVPFGVTRATDDLGRRTVRHDFPSGTTRMWRTWAAPPAS